MTDKINGEINDNDDEITGRTDNRGVDSDSDWETGEDEEYEKRRIRNRARIEQMKQEKLRRLKRQKMIKRIAPLLLAGIFLLVVVIVTVSSLQKKNSRKTPQVPETLQETPQVPETLQEESETEAMQTVQQSQETGVSAMKDTLLMVQDMMTSEAPKASPLAAFVTENTQGFPDTVVSTNGLLIDLDTQEIVAMKNPYERISPASMTKILTVLVAAEHMDNPEDTFTITTDITDYCFVNDCSNVGFEVGEVVTVRDLFYGTILPSGADAALGLAVYTAGSEEAFVDFMNEKLAELGISETTHFTNCVGLYDKEHYSTAYDMAIILKAAYDNPFCREVLSAHTYTTTPTTEHPEGVILSNWFLRRIEDKDTHGEVLCAKTGYVVQSGSCAASLAEDVNGKKYICVTANSSSSWRCIYDHVDLYAKYLAGE